MSFYKNNLLNVLFFTGLVVVVNLLGSINVQAQTHDKPVEAELAICEKSKHRLRDIAKNAREQLKGCEEKEPSTPTTLCNDSNGEQRLANISQQTELLQAQLASKEQILQRLKDIAKGARLQLKMCKNKLKLCEDKPPSECPIPSSCNNETAPQWKDVVMPSLPDKPEFTKEALLNRKLNSNAFPKITTIKKIKFLEADIKYDHGSNPKGMVRVDVTAVSDNGNEYLIREKYGLFNLVEPKSGNTTAFKFRVFFLDKKFHNGTVQKVEFSVSKEVIDQKNVYFLSPENISYEKNRITHTINGDEIHWIKDWNGPSIYALLVCDGQCNTSPPLFVAKKYECEYKIGSHETLRDCTEYFRDASQDFVKKAGQNITEKTTLKLTMTISPIVEVPQTGPVYPGESKIEKKENGGAAKKESNGASGDKVKLVALQKVQFKPYTYLYGEPFDTAKICGYKYEFIDTTNSNIALTKTTAGQDYYFFAKKASKKKQVKTGDKLTIKVTPKPTSEDYCFSGEIETFPVSLNKKIATAKLEIPHPKPWLLVYATSAGFPHSSDFNEKVERQIFWTRIFNKINNVYSTNLSAIQRLYWLTVDVFEPLKNNQPKWLAGGIEKGEPVSKIGLSTRKLRSISQIPQNGISPSFEDYKIAILAYKNKHSTSQNNKFDNVVIIQGQDSFSDSICKGFNNFASSLEEPGINILYINPVRNISPSYYNTENNNGKDGVLKPYLENNGLPIYTCKKPKEFEFASQFFTFEYFVHKYADRRLAVQELLENELQNIKNQLSADQ
jgi:hypothetical protein